jgi:hypothetical protein
MWYIGQQFGHQKITIIIFTDTYMCKRQTHYSTKNMISVFDGSYSK